MHIHGGNVYALENSEQVLDFSANINPLGMSPKGKDAMISAIDSVIHYPDPNNTAVYQSLMAYTSFTGEEILVGNGAAELIYSIARLEGYRKAYVPAPGFSEYREGMVAAKKEVNAYAMVQEDKGDHYVFHYPDLVELMTNAEDTILFVGNPNNPCGSLVTKDMMRHVIAVAKEHHNLVVIDESFIDFIGDEASCRQLIHEFDNLIIVHSLTKFYAIPGLRLGAVFAHPSLIERMEALLPAWTVNRFAQVYGGEALQDTDYIAASRIRLASEKDRVFEAWRQFDWAKPLVPTVNYMLIEWLKSEAEFEQYMANLKEEYILIRDCRAYEHLDGIWFRIAIKDKRSNSRLLEVTQQLMKSN